MLTKYAGRVCENICAVLALVSLAVASLPADQAPAAEPLRNRENSRGAVSRAADHELHPGAVMVRASCVCRRSPATRNGARRRSKDIEAFISGRTPAIAEPYRLTSLAGALAFADAASLAGDKQAGALAETVAARMVEGAGDAGVNFATGWTDDMFMASSVLSRTASGAHADVVGKLLTAYAKKLQRPDGLFIHAENGPHAWGRGNGFALLGLTEALTHLPSSWSARPQVLEIYRRHVAALAKHQSDDGSWRQVVDEPASYRELTVTAMTTAALARGIARGWIDRTDLRTDHESRLAGGGGSRQCGWHRERRVLGYRRGTDEGVLPESSCRERRRRSRRGHGVARGDRNGDAAQTLISAHPVDRARVSGASIGMKRRTMPSGSRIPSDCIWLTLAAWSARPLMPPMTVPRR